MEQYFVYFIDKNSGNIFSGTVPAVSKEDACKMFEQDGRVIAALGIKDGRFIKTNRLSYALSNAGYTDAEIDFICTAVSEFERNHGR